MVEPVSITLAALALLDPAIRSVREAYGVYKLTRFFGEHYASVQRNLDGEQARLECSLETNLASMPNKEVLTLINTHLGHLRKHFKACQDMIASIDGRMAKGFYSTTIVANPDEISQNTGPTIATSPRRSKWKAMFPRKHKQSSTRDSSSGTLTPESTPASSISNLDGNEVVQAATQQADIAEHLQSKATMIMRAKWIGQKKEFEEHLKQIHASNDFIRDMVSMRTLGSIHNILVVPEFKGKIPEDVLAVQDSLHRLHHALNHSNQGSPDDKPLLISIRVMEAAAYVQLKKRLTVQHDYIEFREDSALYPLQMQKSTATSGTVVLAETMMTEQPSADLVGSDTVRPLSDMLLGQSIDAYEAFKNIGSIAESQHSSGVHRLFEDISTLWEVQDTLADLVKSTSKFRTYLHLAVQVSISYMYFATIGMAHRYPRLDDYQYYRPASETKRNLGPNDILEPYLSIGFGSRPPRRSTKDIGGTSGHSLGDEAMTSLGIVLHELGCWKMLDEQDSNSAREAARGQRKDLQTSAGMSYTEVVDLCFAAKEGEWERRARAANIYRKVVAPLQKLVSELRWD